MGTLVRGLVLLSLAVVLVGCATLPENRYGVRKLELSGMKAFDEEALRACLTTTERPRATLYLGARSVGPCGQPPFNVRRSQLQLWSWATTDWPLYDRVGFARDLERIVRWYQARGYNDARVVGTAVDPVAALNDDTIAKTGPEAACRQSGSDEGCQVRLRVVIDEGAPTRIDSLVVRGSEQLDKSIRVALSEALELKPGERFDESLYEVSKQRMLAVLQDHGHALAEVEGAVRIDRAAHVAFVSFEVRAGPRCTFGKIFVEGAPSFLTSTIRAATRISPGDTYSGSALRGAQQAIFSTGLFMTVTVESILPSSGSRVDVRATVTLARKRRFGLGFGMQAGIVTRGDTWDPISVPQWDVHLLAKYTEQRFLNSPGILTLEERPAMVIQEPFPGFTAPGFGNDVRAELRFAHVLEGRTAMRIGAAYVWGPDPYDTFFRHRVDSVVGLERKFLLRERLFVSIGVHNSVYRVPDGATTKSGEPAPADSLVTNFYQRARFDFRDSETQPRRGAMLQVELQEAGITDISSWRYVRTTPDARAYLPLPLDAVLAVRFAVGMYFIFDADPQLDENSRNLGPRDYRLRGGGATSNRGFLPGELGDGPDGGTRRWEASLELRLPVTPTLGLVGFLDAGDVSQKPEFRWNVPQASSGFGLRYRTIVGSLRLDFAWRLPGLQVFGPDPRDPGGDLNQVDFGFAKMNGAVHLTIGEAF